MTRTMRGVAVVVLAIGLFGLAATAGAQTTYTVTDLGVLAGAAGCWPSAIGGDGAVVGQCSRACTADSRAPS